MTKSKDRRAMRVRVWLVEESCAAVLVALSVLCTAILEAQAQSIPVRPAPNTVITVDEAQLVVDGIAGLARLTQNRFVVATVQGGTVALVDSTGALVKIVGRTGSGPGEFRSVAWVGRCDERSAFVYDRANARVSVVDAAGAVTREFAITDSTGRPFVPTALSCSPSGVLAVQTLGREPAGSGTASGTLRFQSDVWVGSVSTGSVNRIASSVSDEMFTMGGGGAPAPLGKRSVLAVSQRDVVTGTGESPALMLHVGGRAPREIPTGIPARRTTPEAFADGIEEVLSMVPAQVVPRVRPVVSALPRPAFFAAYERVSSDECGRLWVTYRRPEAGGHGLRVLARDGKVLGDVALRDRVVIHEIFGGIVTASRLDEDGMALLLLYRVLLPGCG